MTPVEASNMPFRFPKSGSFTTSRDEVRDGLKETVKAEKSISISQAAKLFVVSKKTSYNRIYGYRD